MGGMKSYETALGKRIQVASQPLAKGGLEGEVYKITSPSQYAGACLKIYRPEMIKPSHRSKLEYMVQNIPPQHQGALHKICWPQDIVFYGQHFAGFIMPLAFDNSTRLFDLITLKLPAHLDKSWHKFDRSTSAGVSIRLKLCVNLAIAVHHIHSKKKYVIGDMKPENIMVSKSGQISVIDMDSIQITDGRILFPSAANTEFYVPPEAYLTKNKVLQESWDRFSLAVIFYQILFGIHPYAASFQGAYESLSTIESKIQNQLFVHGQKKQYIKILPPPHQDFKRLSAGLQKLFIRAFDEPPGMRPDAEEWGKCLYQEVEQVKQSKLRFQHCHTAAARPASAQPTTPQAAAQTPTHINPQTHSLTVFKLIKFIYIMCLRVFQFVSFLILFGVMFIMGMAFLGNLLGG